MPERLLLAPSQLRKLDLVVIGAGIYGVQAARAYLYLHPNAAVKIFEASGNIGGVWSRERVYDVFRTQTPLKMLEFSDLPLTSVPDSDTFHGSFAAKHVPNYLETYVKTQSFAGESLASRIHLNSYVKTVNRQESGWMVHVKTPDEHEDQYTASKIIDATGLTSTANIPTLSGRELFRGIVIHHRDFGRQQESLLSKVGPQKIAVLGGAKSAADIAYAFAKAGKDVTWIIRSSGAGPAAFVAAKGQGPYKNSNESFYTRLTANFLVSFFLDESRTWLGRMLYRTSLGRRLLQGVWNSINRKAWNLADYDRLDGKRNGFYNLKPDTSVFWQNDSTGIILHNDFFDTIAHHVKVQRQDIRCFTGEGFELVSGDQVDVDAVFFATGWKTSHPEYRSLDGTNLAQSLGLPMPKQSTSTSDEWADIDRISTEEILIRFPILGYPPPHSQPSRDSSPLRLYKGVIPVNDRSIAFVGQMMLGNHFRAAEVQAIFAVAALDGTLELPGEAEMNYSIAKMISWCRLRYLSKGYNGNWIYWDLIPYTDNLLGELGLQSHRHRSYWKDLLSPCLAAELKDLLPEYKRKTAKALTKQQHPAT